MYPHQAERLSAVLDREGLEALVATAPENLCYVTGFRSLIQASYRGMELFGIFTRRGTALVVPAGDVPTVAAEGVEVDHVGCYGRLFFGLAERADETARRVQEWIRQPAATAADALAAALEALGVRQGRVGLDEGGLGPAAWRRIAERLAGLSLIEAGTYFGAARVIKGPWEIECLQRALHIAEESVNAVIQMLEPGVTEREAALVYQAEVARRGAEPFAVVLLFGERAAILAIGPSGCALKTGDLVRFDLGCVYQGYYSHLGRTAVMGEPKARQQQVWDAIQRGLEAAIDAIGPGVAAGRIFDVAIEATRKAGLAHYDRGHVGHGIGLAGYERPKLAPGNDARVEAGMVLRVETPYYEPGWGGLHIKDTVLVTRGGASVMNRSARGLVVLD